LQPLFSLFPDERLVKGDDHRIAAGRGKPAPDIYHLALEMINKSLPNGEPKIKEEECLVFEDSVPGIEAGRRAGMRVIWVPHLGLLEEYKGREREVLAGLTGEYKDDSLRQQEENAGGKKKGGPGELDDDWGELLTSLENFPYQKYGININKQ
jgi:pseudouridine-5'-monophosphatase